MNFLLPTNRKTSQLGLAQFDFGFNYSPQKTLRNIHCIWILHSCLDFTLKGQAPRLLRAGRVLGPEIWSQSARLLGLLQWLICIPFCPFCHIFDYRRPLFSEFCFNKMPLIMTSFFGTKLSFFLWKGTVITKFRDNKVIPFCELFSSLKPGLTALTYHLFVLP